MNIDKFFKKFLKALKIIDLSITARASLISLSPSGLLRIVVLFFHCLLRKRFNTLNISSIGASEGVYEGINATFAPDFSKISRHPFVLCILELSRIITQSAKFNPRSSLIQISSLVAKSANVLALFVDTSGQANHCHVDVIAIIMLFDPLKHIFKISLPKTSRKPRVIVFCFVWNWYFINVDKFCIGIDHIYKFFAEQPSDNALIHYIYILRSWSSFLKA